MKLLTLFISLALIFNVLGDTYGVNDMPYKYTLSELIQRRCEQLSEDRSIRRTSFRLSCNRIENKNQRHKIVNLLGDNFFFPYDILYM